MQPHHSNAGYAGPCAPYAAHSARTGPGAYAGPVRPPAQRSQRLRWALCAPYALGPSTRGPVRALCTLQRGIDLDTSSARASQSHESQPARVPAAGERQCPRMGGSCLRCARGPRPPCPGSAQESPARGPRLLAFTKPCLHTKLALTKPCPLEPSRPRRRLAADGSSDTRAV